MELEDKWTAQMRHNGDESDGVEMVKWTGTIYIFCSLLQFQHPAH